MTPYRGTVLECQLLILAEVIREIDRRNSRIKIDHGPIPSIAMPAMTMTFKVNNPTLLDQVKRGDQVNFEIEQSGPGWIITNLNRK